MTNGNTRVLQFNSQDLGKDINLMLVFEPPKPENGALYKDLFPVCWKVVTLQATGNATASVTYTADTVFFIPQIDRENLVTVTNFQRCSMGEKCSVTTDSGGLAVVSKAEPGEAGALECYNKVKVATDIGLGFVDKTGKGVDVNLLWKRVAVDDKVKAKLTPMLKIYASTNYQETEILKGDVESPLLWTKNLGELSAQSQLSVKIDATTGKIVIT